MTDMKPEDVKCRDCGGIPDIMDNEYNEAFCASCASKYRGSPDEITSWTELRPGNAYSQEVWEDKNKMSNKSEAIETMERLANEIIDELNHGIKEKEKELKTMKMRRDHAVNALRSAVNTAKS